MSAQNLPFFEEGNKKGRYPRKTRRDRFQERKAAENSLGEYFKIALDVAQENSDAIPQDPEDQDDLRSAL